MNHLNVGGKLLNLSSPKVMGILNVTPDSFFDGGKYNSIEEALSQVKSMIDDGAQIIDIGGFSSRPSAKLISVDEELKRILPIVKEVTNQFPKIILSVDTYRSKVVDKVATITSFIVNDITASSQDSNLFNSVSYQGLPYVLMHMQGIPEKMQNDPRYVNVSGDVLDFFAKAIYKLKEKNINQLILDPGFGFGKTVDHNFELLKNINLFNIYDLPVLAGISRKSMIYKVLDNDAKDALNGTTALHMCALINGAKILRAHDVKEAVETITLYEKIKSN